MRWLLICLALPCLAAEIRFAGETLRYSINWPTGLSLGEAEIAARPKGGAIEYEFRLDASLPGFPISDSYRSLATPEFCTLEFEKHFTHGNRKSVETTTIAPGATTAVRETEKGGKSQMTVSTCAKDALAFLYWLRNELQKGRVPPQQPILFGAQYQISLKFGATQKILVNDRPYEADRVEATVKGPASETQFELFLGRDSSRKLLMARVPFSLGRFSMELLD